MILPIPATRELFKYPYHPTGTPFEIKRSLRPFSYKAVKQLTIHIKNIPEGSVEFSLGAIKALHQEHPIMSSPECVINGSTILFPTTLRPRETRTIDSTDYNFEPWEYFFFDSVHYRKYDGNNQELDNGVPLGEVPIVRHGINTITYRQQGTNKALVTILLEDAPSFHGDHFIWFNPLDFIPLSFLLSIGWIGHTTLRVTTTQPGDLHWIALGLTLPSNILIKQITVHYKLSHSRSYISQVRLTETIAPGVSIVKHDDGTDLTSTTAAVYHSHVNDLEPNGSITLALRLSFADASDAIEIGGIGILVKEF